MARQMRLSGGIPVERKLLRTVNGSTIVFPSDPLRKVFYARRNFARRIQFFPIFEDGGISTIEERIFLETDFVLSFSSERIGLFEVCWINLSPSE